MRLIPNTALGAKFFAPSLPEPRVHRSRLAIILALCAATSAAAQSPFSTIKWRSIGPVNTSGRIDDIAVARVRGEADAIYVATASGGSGRARTTASHGSRCSTTSTR
jgi:hypothetical protein